MATQPSDTSKRSPQRTVTDELAVIAQRAQAFTNASGAAVALSEGIADEIVCKARSGSSAPEVGAALRVEGSFTGVCIQSGRELRCDDTETDTRVDTVAVRALGIRSMVITPIKEDNKAVGVLAVFASTPHAFTITHVAVLKTMADQISGLMQKERRAREEGGHPEPPVVRAPSTPPLGPVAVRPIAPVPTPIPIRTVTPMPAKIEPIQPVALAADVSVPVPFPRREEPRPELKEQPVVKSSFGTLDSMAEQPRSSGSKLAIIGLLVVTVAGASTWFYMRTRRAQPPVAQIAQPSAPAATQPAADANAGANGNGTTPGAPSTGPGATTSGPAASAPPANQPAAPAISVKPTDRAAEAAKRAAAQEKPSPSTPAPIALTGGPSKIAVNNQQQAQTTADVAPSLTMGSGSSSALSSLARPVSGAAPTASLAQSELTDVQLLRSVPPVYPAIAKSRRVTGTVNVKVRVGKEGRVVAAQFVDGPVVFKDSALEAVKQWQYKPATLDGKPIEQETSIKLNFKP